MAWLFYCLVQTLIVVGLLLGAAFAGHWLISAALVFGAALFLLRSLNHPDYFLRRAMWACLNAAFGQLFVLRLAEGLSQSEIPKIAAAIIYVVDSIFGGSETAFFVLIGAAIIFGALDVARTTLDHNGKTVLAKPWLQITAISEWERKDGLESEVIVRLTNETDRAFTLTDPVLTRLELLPWARPCTTWLQVTPGASRPAIDRDAGITVVPGGGQVDMVLRVIWTETGMRGSCHRMWRGMMKKLGVSKRRRATLSTKAGVFGRFKIHDTHSLANTTET